MDWPRSATKLELAKVDEIVEDVSLVEVDSTKEVVSGENGHVGEKPENGDGSDKVFEDNKVETKVGSGEK